MGLLVLGLAPALAFSDPCVEWPNPVWMPVEGLGENVPEDRGSMSIGWVGERRRRFCNPGMDRAAPLLLGMLMAEIHRVVQE